MFKNIRKNRFSKFNWEDNLGGGGFMELMKIYFLEVLIWKV